MISVVPAEIDDLINVSALENKTFSEPWRYEDFVASFNNEASCILVAKDEHGVMAGYAVGYFSYEQGELPTIAVDESFRGQKVGYALLAALEAIAKKKGVLEFFLEVRPSNDAALNLYKKDGFEQIGVRKAFYTKPDEDAYLMRKILEETYGNDSNC